jgi:hypothetical protein
MTTTTVRPYRLRNVATGHILTTVSFRTHAAAVAYVRHLNQWLGETRYAITREQP